MAGDPPAQHRGRRTRQSCAVAALARLNVLIEDEVFNADCSDRGRSHSLLSRTGGRVWAHEVHG